MAIGVKVKSKSSKRRDVASEQAKSGNSAKNQSLKDNAVVWHQVKNTSRKAYSPKNRGQGDLKTK